MKKQKTVSKKVRAFLWLHRRRLGWFTVLFAGLLIIQLTYNWHAGQPRLFGYSTQISQEELLNQTNEYRNNSGLDKLVINQQLANTAQEKAEAMVKQQTDKIDSIDYPQAHYKNQNIAYGFTESSEIVAAWNQDKNNKSVLGQYKDVGYGVIHNITYQGVVTTLVVALYGQPDQTSPTSTLSQQGAYEVRGFPLITTGGAPWAIYASLALLLSVSFGFVMTHFELFRAGLYRHKKALLTHPAFDTAIILLLSCSFIQSSGGFIQ